ncbi:ABC transporter ATP-binding protein [Rossellomorea aquimaris]|uniref:ABC transporter ATP-binding protein n=1 Tax=Rossellomorea aquimaris TaxID=189382 RepID=UPI001CD77F50|nr:ABC transporter ATP-binding protein [Rossellomorea aquimaris]MCA1054495.1 ABC transporter ATP-binding protein [Rossellomorea aquimaris]
MNVLEVADLEKRYKEKHAVERITFQLKQGNCTALIGPNGAGKTTSLNMLAGLIEPTGGKIHTPGHSGDIRSMIGYLPQYPSFFEWMSGFEYLQFSGEIAGLSKAKSRQRSEELVEMVGLSEGKDRKIHHYSGGMKQRLGIAQALIHQPKLIILDEPVSALDPFGRREVLDLLQRLKEETTILFSTHILNDAEQVCDEVLFLYNGKLIEQGSLSDIKSKHQTLSLRIEFEGRPTPYIDDLKGLPWVDSVKEEHDSLLLQVEELKRDRNRLFKLISEGEWPVVKVESSKLSLEDLFMKVMRV